MSIVEKALERLRSESDGHRPIAAVRAADIADPTVPNLRRIVQIDEEQLRRSGILAPVDEAHRAADEYRAIKRRILDVAFGAQSAGTRDRRLIAISSALPGDGKTHTSINLALSLALEKDHSAVLIDADVAKADTSKLLGVANEPGLLDLLASDQVTLRSVLLQTDRPNLWILPSGTRTEVATELLASQRMREVCAAIISLIPQAAVLLDAAPILVTSEAPVLVSVAGQIVLVVKAGETQQAAVLDAIQRIGNPGNIQLVLNQAEVSGLSTYYDGRWYRYGASHMGKAAGRGD
jgi:protein-tyrosine kinase